ncbi:MAG: molecular chaperone HtpG [Myxococcota bacterium]
MTAEKQQTHQFQAEVSRVLRLVVDSLYSNREVFLRELISNASDALDKLRFRAITEPDLLDGDEALGIRIVPDEAAGTLTIEDNGIGMNAEELARDLGTIAHSGSQELLQKLEEAKKGDLELIGQFGVGFYSAFLVADRVEVISRAAGDARAHRWASDGKDTFTVEPAQRPERGTSVVLHLNTEHHEFLRPERLRQVVSRYSDYLGHPIELAVDRDGERTFETINTGQALWRRPASEVTDDQYREFYKHLAHDWEPPLAWKHFKVEGTQEFTGLVFVPKARPFDLYSPDQEHGVRLYVKRVFVMEDCKELLPKWLRFVRGVVDSEDLPLNVSRELLQDSRVVRTIRKQLVKQVLELLAHVASERPDDYAIAWRNFGAVIKEGLYFEPEHRDRLAKLLRFETSTSAGALRSLAEYAEAMPEGQEAIYYALGPSREHLDASPHLEALRKKGYEVLYMTDPVDQWAVQGLPEHEGKPLVSASDPNLDLGAQDEDGEGADADQKEPSAELTGLLQRIRTRLQDHLEEARVSRRLTDSPVCLVVPEGGLQPWIERVLRSTQGDAVPRQKRILEVNPDHPLIRSLQAMHQQQPEGEPVDGYIDLLFDQALLAEGSPVEEPAAAARRLADLLTRVTTSAVTSGEQAG